MDMIEEIYTKRANYLMELFEFVSNCCTSTPISVMIFVAIANYSGLYSAAEVQSIANQMNIGVQSKLTSERLDAYFNKFLQQVRINVHVMVCLRFSGMLKS
jgi:hypothetical protein